jgi:hypothetical protein
MPSVLLITTHGSGNNSRPNFTPHRFFKILLIPNDKEKVIGPNLLANNSKNIPMPIPKTLSKRRKIRKRKVESQEKDSQYYKSIKFVWTEVLSTTRQATPTEDERTHNQNRKTNVPKCLKMLKKARPKISIQFQNAPQISATNTKEKRTKSSSKKSIINVENWV